MLALVVSIIAAVVAAFSAYFSYQANILAAQSVGAARNTFTHTVKSEFADKFPDGAKGCLTYFHQMDDAQAALAVKGQPHKITSQAQLDSLNDCMVTESKAAKIDELVQRELADNTKNKTKKALRVIEHAASQLENTDTCALARELYGVMQWPELMGAVRKFREFGVIKNPNLFAAIQHYQDKYGTERGLSAICKPS